MRWLFMPIGRKALTDMKEANPRLALGRLVLLAVLVAVTAGPGCEERTAERAPTKA